MELNKLYFGDSLDIMPIFPDHIFDMVLADLPYELTQNKWDIKIPLERLWPEYKRLIKPNGVIALTASQPFSSLLVMSNLEMYKHEWIWIKNRGSNFANTVREPFKEHEQVLIFSNGNWTYNKQMQERTGTGKSRVKYDFNHVTKTPNYNKFTKPSDSKGKLLRVPSSHQKFNTEVGLHSTQKPVKLMEYLIKTYSNEGELILDNCAGSGTTGIACINLKRNFILIENGLKSYETAKKRIENYKL